MITHRLRHDLFNFKTALNEGNTNWKLMQELGLAIQEKLKVVAPLIRSDISAGIYDIGLTSDLISYVDNLNHKSDGNLEGWSEFVTSWKDFVFETYVQGAADPRWFSDTKFYRDGTDILEKIPKDTHDKIVLSTVDEYVSTYILFDTTIIKLGEDIHADNKANDKPKNYRPTF